jgi:tuftelin-interacting protein 11
MERDILEAEEEMAAEEAAENAAVDEESSSEESSQSEPRGSPRVPDQEKEDEPPVRSGFGASKSMAAKFGLQGATATPTNEPAMARSGRGGIGSKKPASIPEDDIPEASTSFSSAGLPTAFGTPGGAANGAPRVQQSFLRNENAAAAQAANLTAEEKRHFSGLQGSYGARLLEKMGWQVVCNVMHPCSS